MMASNSGRVAVLMSRTLFDVPPPRTLRVAVEEFVSNGAVEDATQQRVGVPARGWVFGGQALVPLLDGKGRDVFERQVAQRRQDSLVKQGAIQRAGPRL